jgi:hypothetical protein
MNNVIVLWAASVVNITKSYNQDTVIKVSNVRGLQALFEQCPQYLSRRALGNSINENNPTSQVLKGSKINLDKLFNLSRRDSSIPSHNIRTREFIPTDIRIWHSNHSCICDQRMSPKQSLA